MTASNFTFFNAISPDASLAQRYGGNENFKLTAKILMNIRGLYYTNAWGRGCINAASGFAASATLGVTGCEYNGQRWFDGPSPTTNETVDDPQATHPVNGGTNLMVGGLTNAGAVTGATTVHIPHSYETQQNFYRQVEGAMGGVTRAADFNVYWGAGGLIDSVIDVTHNVAVPFSPTIGSSFGVLNTAAGAAGLSSDARGDVLTSADMGCVEPWKSFPSVGGAAGILPCAAGPAYLLEPDRGAGAGGYLRWKHRQRGHQGASARARVHPVPARCLHRVRERSSGSGRGLDPPDLCRLHPGRSGRSG